MSVAWVVTVVNGDSGKTVRVPGHVLTESESEDVEWHAKQRYENCIVTLCRRRRIEDSRVSDSRSGQDDSALSVWENVYL
jgi:hypothetical protein